MKTNDSVELSTKLTDIGTTKGIVVTGVEYVVDRVAGYDRSTRRFETYEDPVAVQLDCCPGLAITGTPHGQPSDWAHDDYVERQSKFKITEAGVYRIQIKWWVHSANGLRQLTSNTVDITVHPI